MITGSSERRRGTVHSFDDETGLGVIQSGDAEWPFHCTAIADGTRTIAAGASVDFISHPAHHGRWEAADIQTAG